jgi:serine/threonine-protein kinase RsbW
MGVAAMDPVDSGRATVLVRESFSRNQLRRLRELVLGIARRAGLTVQRSHQFMLAVNEAVTNVIKHAGGAGELEVIQDDRRRLIAVVSDHGPGLPAGTRPNCPPPEALGGRGLMLIQRVCDRVELRSGTGGTRVSLEIDLPARV